MQSNRIGRLSAVILTASSAFLLSTSTAHAQASITRFELPPIQLPTAETVVECRTVGDATGTQTGTETITGQVVETGGTLHIRTTALLEYMVVFADGSVVEGTSTEHFSLNTNGERVTQTVTVQESRSIEGPSGEPVATARIHAVSHLTFSDANGNGEAEPDEIRASVDRFFVTCK